MGKDRKSSAGVKTALLTASRHPVRIASPCWTGRSDLPKLHIVAVDEPLGGFDGRLSGQCTSKGRDALRRLPVGGPRLPLRQAHVEFDGPQRRKCIGRIIFRPSISCLWTRPSLWIAIDRAGKSLRDLRVAEVVQLDLQMDDGKIEAYRAKLKVSFKFEG
jgi:Dodecin